MAPFYAWGLYLGQGPRKTATVCLWLLAAWMVTEVFWLGRLFTGREGPALLGAAGAALALPGLIYSNLAFPEIAAAAFAVSAFRLMRSASRGQWGLLFLAGLLTAYLPWFHERFAVPCLVLGAYFLARMHWRSLKGLAAFALPCLVSAGLLAAYFMWLYGQPYPGQEIHAQGAYLNPRGFWEGLSGIWVGRRRGHAHLRGRLAGGHSRSGVAGAAAAVRRLLVFGHGRGGVRGGRAFRRLVRGHQPALALSGGRGAFLGRGPGRRGPLGTAPLFAVLCGSGSAYSGRFAMGDAPSLGGLWPHGGAGQRIAVPADRQPAARLYLQL